MRVRRAVVVIGAALSLFIGLAPAAGATPAERQNRGQAEAECFPNGCDSSAEAATTGEPSGGEATTMMASGSGWWVTCEGKNHNAHYSSGAGGAIYKTDIWCYGQGVASVSVNYRGSLRYSYRPNCTTYSLSWATRASANYSQWVGVSPPTNPSGIVKTFYTPRTGHGGTGNGWWSMNSTWQFMANGVPSSVGSHHNYVCKPLYSWSP